ncbi:hypothetical protein K1719_025993 [Acacia pycnantha]|nr:hypothetical protein K1719_025993 [Acacia pycnantha]
MAPFESSSSLLSSLRSKLTLALHIASLISLITSTTGCHFISIFSFGDSLADTGNLYFTSQPPPFHYCHFLHLVNRTSVAPPEGAPMAVLSSISLHSIALVQGVITYSLQFFVKL